MFRQHNHVLRHTVLAFVTALPLLAAAQTLTLEEAIRRAVAQNFSVRIARITEEQAQVNTERGNAGYLPTVTLNSTGTYVLQQFRKQTNNAFFSDTTGLQTQFVERNNVTNQSFNSNLNVTYTIFDGLQRKAFYRQLQTLARLADQDTRVALETTITDVTRAYYDLVQQQAQTRLLEQTLTISQERVRIAQERQAVGAGSGLEYLQSTVDLNADRSALLRQRATATNAALTLTELMGERSRLPLSLADTSIVVDTTLRVDALDLNNNRQLARFRYEIQLRDWELQQAKGQRWPVLSFTGVYNYNISEAGPFFQGFNTRPFFNTNYGPSAVVGLSIPLFDGGRIRRNIQQAELNEEATRLRAQQTELTLNANLDRRWTDYRVNVDLIGLEQANVEVALRNADVALERFRIGSSTPLELREAQIAAVQAQQRLLQAEFGAKVAQVDLQRLTGQVQLGE